MSANPSSLLTDRADCPQPARANAADPAGEAVQRMGDPAVVAQGFRRGRRGLVMVALLLWLPAAVAVTVGVGAASPSVSRCCEVARMIPRRRSPKTPPRGLPMGTGRAVVRVTRDLELARLMGLKRSSAPNPTVALVADFRAHVAVIANS